MTTRKRQSEERMDGDLDEFGRNRHSYDERSSSRRGGQRDDDRRRDDRRNRDEGEENLHRRSHDDRHRDEDERRGSSRHRNGHRHHRRERSPPDNDSRYRNGDDRRENSRDDTYHEEGRLENDRRYDRNNRSRHDENRRYEDEARRYEDDNHRHYNGDRHYEYEQQQQQPEDNFENPLVLEDGIIVKGRVSRIEPYGAFIDFNAGRDRHRGLAHISQLVEGQRVNHVEEVVQMNQPVFASVLEVQQQGNQRPRIRLSLKEVDQVTGMKLDASSKATSHATRDPVKFRRATDRLRMLRQEACSWKDGEPPNLPYERLLYSRSPSPPPVKAAEKSDSSDSDSDSSSSSSSSSESSSSSSSSSSSEESRRRRRRKRRGSSRRDKRSSRSSSRRKRHRRRRSPSFSSSSSSSDSSSSSSSSVRSSDRKRARRESPDDSKVPTEPAVPAETTVAAMDEDDLREAKEFRGAVQGAHDAEDSDDEEEGPMPLPQTNAAAGGGSARSEYGKALLPGEGQAIAAYVQQNLRIPRRGEIGYSGEQVEQYEKSGYVMSGSRHARMNAVRIRKENQVYSAEEQRALALITAEENQQKEAQLLQDFRTMLKEKQKLRERPAEGKEAGQG